MVRSRSYFKSLADVFRSSSATEKDMHVQLARLCVLYEDLQLEWSGADADRIAALDRIDVNTRRFYFVRRTLGTLTEVEQAFAKLNANAAFKIVKTQMPAAALKAWDKAVKFFAQEHVFLKDWRNDVGGHFSDAAATYALNAVDESTVGVIEVYRRGNGADVKMPFAYELVAIALTKNKGAANERKFLERAFTFLKKGVEHATSGIQIVTNMYLLGRFK